MTLAQALLAELGPDDLAALATRLRPYLPEPAPPTDDGWLGTRDAASYAGASADALHKAAAAGAVEFEQPGGPGGKMWFRRAAIDRWRRGE